MATACSPVRYRDAWRRWNLLVMAVVTLTLATLPASNYLVDPYGIFGSDLLPLGTQSNERYLKTEHLLSRLDDYDALVLGSSRMGLLSARAVRDYADHRWYNLSFFSAMPEEILALLKLLEEHDWQPEAVLLGIDLYPLQGEATKAGPAFRAHPAVTGEARWRFQFDYLFASSAAAQFSKAVGYLAGLESIRFNLANGTYQLPELERRLSEDFEAYRDARLAPNLSTKAADIRWDDRRLAAYADIAAWLSQRQIPARLFLHPLHPGLRAHFSERSLVEIRQRLRDRLRAYAYADLSDLDTVTGNDRLWYEPKHFRPAASDLILTALTKQTHGPIAAPLARREANANLPPVQSGHVRQR